MSSTSTILLAVATELAEQAKASMPKLLDGERVKREWYKNGVYYRETVLGDELFQVQYDFRQRKIRRMAVIRE